MSNSYDQVGDLSKDSVVKLFQVLARIEQMIIMDRDNPDPDLWVPNPKHREGKAYHSR